MYNASNTTKRKGADDEAYAEGWDRIFGKKDDKCKASERGMECPCPDCERDLPKGSVSE